MPARLFVGYFVALAACATIAFASFGIDGSEEAASSAAAPPASAFHVYPHKLLPKHVQVAQAQ